MPIIQHLIAAYKLWHEFLPHVSKDSRYTLGIKIDALFVEMLNNIFTAHYLSKEQKLPDLKKANAHLDLIKFFLQVLWEIKALDNKKYITLSEKLNENGKMLGGWMRQLSQKETPTFQK